MGKLVQYAKWNIPNVALNKMYYYGEADFESNYAMQEPLEKLYKYENQPDMREKVKEYISELDAEIDRCTKFVEGIFADLQDEDKKEMYTYTTNFIETKTRIQTLNEVRNDLESRLNELI